MPSPEELLPRWCRVTVHSVLRGAGVSEGGRRWIGSGRKCLPTRSRVRCLSRHSKAKAEPSSGRQKKTAYIHSFIRRHVHTLTWSEGGYFREREKMALCFAPELCTTLDDLSSFPRCLHSQIIIWVSLHMATFGPEEEAKREDRQTRRTTLFITYIHNRANAVEIKTIFVIIIMEYLLCHSFSVREQGCKLSASFYYGFLLALTCIEMFFPRQGSKWTKFEILKSG